MLKLPSDKFVTIELVHDPSRLEVDPSSGRTPGSDRDGASMLPAGLCVSPQERQAR